MGKAAILFNFIKKEIRLTNMDREEWIMAIRKRGDKLLFEENGEREEFTIIPNSIRYWCADPFLINKDGKEYVFFEMYDRWKEKGLVGYREILEDGKFSKMKVVLECPYHLSYPNIFEKDGEVYFIPESYMAEEIAVFKATEFPDKWEKCHVLMGDIIAVDTTFINEEYAITRTGTEGAEEKGAILLKVDGEKLVRAANNPVETEDSYARCGGKIFDYSGNKIRPAQDCVGGYGMGIYFRRIEKCDETAFIEETIKKIEVKDIRHNGNRVYDGIHTYNFDENYEIVDLKIAKAYHFINVVSRYKNRGKRLVKKVLRRK